MANHIDIDQEKCKGCELCTSACPFHIIRMSPDRINGKGYTPAELHDPDGKCSACALCFQMCPDVCITVHKD